MVFGEKEEYKDEHVHFVVTCSEQGILEAVFVGTGSQAGTEKFISIVEHALAFFLPQTLCVLMDLRQQTAVPLRTQLRMGTWLLQVKDKIAKIAILGGGKTAQLVAKGAKLQSIQFFSKESEDDAKNWLSS